MMLDKHSSRPRPPRRKAAEGVETGEDINARIAARVHALRTRRGLSLEALAVASGVSRSMISLVERGESSATAVLLEKLATALDVPLAQLFDPIASEPGPVSRRALQPVWRDPHSGYLRRNVSPSGAASPLQIVEVEFPAGATVAYETAARPTALHQQVWVLDGRMEVTVGETRHSLAAGDCVAFLLDRPVAFHNPSRRPARYAVVLGVWPSMRGAVS